jgi:hypothetical protein
VRQIQSGRFHAEDDQRSRRLGFDRDRKHYDGQTW